MFSIWSKVIDMLARSYYETDIADFLSEDPDKVLGELI